MVRTARSHEGVTVAWDLREVPQLVNLFLYFMSYVTKCWKIARLHEDQDLVRKCGFAEIEKLKLTISIRNRKNTLLLLLLLLLLI